MFIRTESFYQFRKSYPIVTWLVGINLGIWLLTEFVPDLFYLGAGSNHLIALGEYWRILTPIFLHAGLTHVVFNMFSLVLFGPGLEIMLGKAKFILMYLFAGIVGNIGTLFIGPSYYNHVGASGAIFGIFGVYIFIVLFRKNLMDQTNSQIVTTIFVISLVMTFFGGNINILGHLFGFIGGFIIAPFVLAGAKPFYLHSVYRGGSGSHDTQIRFDPNRWNKRRFWKRQWTKNIIWGILILLVLFGLAGTLL
ncbi:rhomboid family intramembrane serine protease [Bacillaceae bacterium S4-13-58]